MKLAVVLVGAVTLIATLGSSRAQSPGPTAPVETLDKGLTVLLSSATSISFAKRYAQLEPIVDQAFDLEVIIKAVIGPSWTTLPAEQQGALLKAFRGYTVANYVANFSGGNDTIIKMLAGANPVSGGQMVPTQIASGTGEPTRINYLVKQDGGVWRINDIYLDGTISQVAVQRSDFRHFISSSSDAAPLIGELHKKVADLSNGAVRP